MHPPFAGRTMKWTPQLKDWSWIGSGIKPHATQRESMQNSQNTGWQDLKKAGEWRPERVHNG